MGALAKRKQVASLLCRVGCLMAFWTALGTGAELCGAAEARSTAGAAPAPGPLVRGAPRPEDLRKPPDRARARSRFLVM